jgi:hypothetical protein
MATPAFLRYLPSRLKPLRSPAVWAPITIFLLLSAFIWEFRDNPDWFNRNQSISDNASSPLTPEEQAKLSEIDTIDVLLGETRTPNTPSTNADPANPTSPTNPESATDPNNPDSRLLSGREDPFGAYTAEYQFPGAANAANSLRPNGSVSSAGGFSGGNSGGSAGGGTSYSGAPIGSTAPSNSSALSQALDRQASRSAAGQAAGQTAQSPAANSGGQPSFGGASGGTPAQPAVSSGGSIDVPFIRTTPSMSPAVGTTGYQAPATSNLPIFNTAPPQPSRNPYSPAPVAPVQPSTVPQAGLYTAPSSTQPAQNQQIR